MKHCRVILLATLATGCGSVYTTNPPHTATEQFLHTVAARQAVEGIAADALDGHAVFVQADALHQYAYEKGEPAEHGPSPEQKYLVAELRAKLLASGARLVDAPEKSEVIVDLWSGGLGVDRYQTIIGVPSAMFTGIVERLNAPLPQTPEVAIYRNHKQLGIGDVGYIAYWNRTGEVIAFSDPSLGVGRREDVRFFIVFDKKVGNVPTIRDAREQ